MSTEDELQKLRETIDSIDVQLQALVSQRAQCAQEVAKVKLAERLDAGGRSLPNPKPPERTNDQ